MTEQRQNPEHVVATPVAGSDLDKELTQAKRGLSKVTVGLGVLVLALAAFFGGVWTHSAIAGSTTPAAQQPQRPGGGQGGIRIGPGGQGGQGGQGGGLRSGTMGTVDRIEGDTIYLKMPDGSEVKVTTSDATKVEKTVEGEMSDITPGSSVVVQGPRGEDGSVSANSITQRPAS
ncbi:DUF5666 domain-containing protein [Kibdelosporangium persicum]|uniref:DUF5666 domain-containing protein n=1 Tax=Kibdelosporangium persicum TaxID=2698649 RepID=A0ABX2FB33_9PSEU|nr:DUF5666 domain-containing protein [Kibdelosporangium persicum]NRN68591.1 hypothetical protein [Kibdelosporangium persicum]